MVSDAHFITPTDGKVNGQRSNYPHGTVEYQLLGLP
jgi:endonuclease I